jgi:hypothetical protein
MGHWLAALNIVTEGWEAQAKKLGNPYLQSSTIDGLLNDAEKKEILRDYRNVVYHYSLSILTRDSEDFLRKAMMSCHGPSGFTKN